MNAEAEGRKHANLPHSRCGLGAIDHLHCRPGRDGARTIIYVDANATTTPHDGSSWCNAYVTLHEALVSASADTTIRIANGTYVPDDTGLSDPRGAEFQLINGVAIEGGYAGCNDGGDIRDIELYETILSGDRYGDDGLNSVNNGENCYHVVSGDNTDASAILDGVTVAHGNAGHFGGGAMIIVDGSPIVRRCRFVSSRASLGGAIYIRRGSPAIVSCRFHENVATDNTRYVGSAIYAGDSYATIANCLFSGNSKSNTDTIGITYGKPRLINCTLVNNAYPVLAILQSPALIANCIIWQNNSPYPPFKQIDNSPPTADIRNCCIQYLEYYCCGYDRYNFGEDPVLVDTNGPDGIPGSADDDYRLTAVSPCINAGDRYAALPFTTDLEGSVRFQHCRPDIGAFESPYPPALWEDCNVNTENDDCDIYEGRSTDHNQNMLPDDCEADFDADGDVDLDDYALFRVCLTVSGPGQPPVFEECNGSFDFTGDGDVDLQDFFVFQQQLVRPLEG